MSHRCGVLAVLAMLLPIGPDLVAQSSPSVAPTYRDLVYARAGEHELRLDLYLPEKPAGRLPLLVWIHGGAWREGSKDRCPAAPLAARGYAVASIGYRLSNVARFPAQIHDSKAAIRWLRANAERYHIDPERVGVWGASAGGHLATLVGTSGEVKQLEGDLGNLEHSSRVQAVVDYFGPTDFLRMDDFPGQMNHDAADSPESQLVGGAIQENKAMVAAANPITYVDSGDPTFLIVHGDRDPLVPVNQSELLHNALVAAGVDVTIRILQGAGHGGKQFHSPETLSIVYAFLDRHLKNGPAR